MFHGSHIGEKAASTAPIATIQHMVLALNDEYLTPLKSAYPEESLGHRRPGHRAIERDWLFPVLSPRLVPQCLGPRLGLSLVYDSIESVAWVPCCAVRYRAVRIL